MGKIISLVNQKGGVGKTTTSINLASSLGLLGKKVLLVDFDPQGNATTGVGVEKGGLTSTIYEALIGEKTTKEIIKKTKFKNLDLIPANVNLAVLDTKFSNLKKADPTFSRSIQLKRVLEEARDNYDYILIDCPPSLGTLITNALTASDSVIIPVQCEFFALEGIMQLLNTIRVARTTTNPNLEIEGVVLTMLDSRTILGLDVVENIRSFFKEKVYDTIIPRLIVLAEAPSHGKPIANYNSKSKGTTAYINLAKEVIERNAREEESTR
ncbi:MAG: ParA family protein [Bacilli bacterium]|nr:ParA family protein [Bacilli bacterium]